MPRKTNNSNGADNNSCIDSQESDSANNDIKTDCDNQDNQDNQDISVNKKPNKERQFLYGKLLKINKGE